MSGQSLPIRGLYAILNVPCPGELSALDRARAMIEGGISWLQLRAKHWTFEERRVLASQLRPLCREAGVGFVVNDDLRTAIEVKADLVHIGQEDLAADPELPARARAAGLGLGISTHTYAQFLEAQVQPWSYVAIGPVFGTRTKQNPEPSVGLDEVKRCMAQARRPVVAIGGITVERAAALCSMGVECVAVVSAIEGSSPAQIVQRCRAFERAAGVG